MSERANDKRLQELRDSGETIYSISRLDTINNCLAEAKMTYIDHLKQRPNIYASLGGRIHDELEKIVNNESTEENLLPAMNAELDDLEMLGLEFPKDFKGGDSIRTGWVTDMTHFCNTYKSPQCDGLHTEELFIYKTPKGRYLQGYIDLYKENKDGTISIYDYKTSSMYNAEGLKDHGRQLILYALGKEQEGYDVKSVAWIFLKYADISFFGKKTARSKEKTWNFKTIERKKIGTEMAKYVEQDLYELGYDEIDSDIILQNLKDTNNFDCLPIDLKDNYILKPCVYYYELTDETKKECIEYIDKTIDMWESINEYPPRQFTKLNKSGKEKEDIFFCLSLCGHFEHCPYIKEYLDRKDEVNEEDDDLF